MCRETLAVNCGIVVAGMAILIGAGLLGGCPPRILALNDPLAADAKSTSGEDQSALVAPEGSKADGQSIVRATAGIWLGDNSSLSVPDDAIMATSSGAYLSKEGVWTNAAPSDSSPERATVDSRAIVETLARVPIQFWTCGTDAGAPRHLSPSATDFNAAFEVGTPGGGIASLDAEGVALAAVQGLYQLLQEKDAALAAQQEQIDRLEARLQRLESLLTPPAAGTE